MDDPGRMRNRTSPSTTDGDGVRIVREQAPRRPWLLIAMVVVAVVAVAIVNFARWSTPPQVAGGQSSISDPPSTARVDVAPMLAPEAEATMTPPPVPPTPPATPQSSPADWRTGDANDIATYVSPTDPEPTAAELIQALRDSGEYGGIAAFNPPGTSPPLKGLAVPESFELPLGYVRHHQVTDAGEPLEAILMFSPDYSFRDAAGNPISIPEDRVVPPEMAPPGLPLREIEIPPPPE